MPEHNRIPVLMVDDVPANLIALEALLAELPHALDLVKAGSGEEALRLTLKRDFALILLDVQMPGMNGFETAELLRANPKTRHLPILFVTAGMHAERQVFAGYELGAVDYLVKPIAAPILCSKVGVFCELYAQRQELEAHRISLSAQVEKKNAELTVLTKDLKAEIETRRATEARLCEFRDQLETRVEERTRDLEKVLHQVADTERLALLGRIVASVAHELNTPIGNCIGVASMLETQAKGLAAGMQAGSLRRGDLQSYVNDANTGGELLLRNLQRASDLVDSFKNMAVDQTNNPRREFDLGRVLEHDIATLGPMCRKTPHRLHADLQPGIVLDSYPGTMGQILNNFITNALTHAFVNRSSGSMYVRTRLLDSDDAEIVFSDDGVGIPEQHLQRVFDPFFTTRLGEAAGLGLSIVHNLVTGVLGGRITLESCVNHGTKFTVTVPRHAPRMLAA